MNTTEDIRLYFVMRADMASMTPGRVAAQVAHGQSLFHNYVNLLERNEDDNIFKSKSLKSAKSWAEQANGFGTVIVLKADENKIKDIFSNCIGNTEVYICGYIVDPEYHLRDGDTVHTLKNILTGAYFLTTKENAKTLFEGVPLL